MSFPTSPAPGSPASPSFAVTSPADILSYVPHALGFMPRESLVVLTMSGRRMGATLRVDLPPVGADPLIFSQGVLSFLSGDTEADGVLLILYCQQVWQRLAPPPMKALVTVLEAVLETAHLVVRGGWFVSEAGWRDYFCGDEHCCSWPGRPLRAVADSALNAEMIYGGSAFDTSAPAAVLRQAPAVLAQSAPLLRRADTRSAQAHHAARCSGHWTGQAQFRATSALWEAVLEREVDVETLPDVSGFLLASVESRTFRDFLLVSACLGPGPALAGATQCGLLVEDAPDGPARRAGRNDVEPAAPILPALGTPEAGYGHPAAGEASVLSASTLGAPRVSAAGDDHASRYTDVLAGRFTGSIAWDRVDAMSRLLARLAAVAEGESRAAVLTMSAWFEYARGRGSRAAVFLEAAEQAVPGYRLALLLHELLRRGGLPVWARHRSTAWTTTGGAPAGRHPTTTEG